MDKVKILADLQYTEVEGTVPALPSLMPPVRPLVEVGGQPAAMLIASVFPLMGLAWVIWACGGRKR